MFSRTPIYVPDRKMKQNKDWGQGYSIRECGQRWRWHLSKDQVMWEASHAEERTTKREQSEAKGPWQDIVGYVPGRWGRQLVRTVMVLWRLLCTPSPLSLSWSIRTGSGDGRPRRGRTARTEKRTDLIHMLTVELMDLPASKRALYGDGFVLLSQRNTREACVSKVSC